MAVTAQWLFYNYTMIENYTFLRNESQFLKFLYFRQVVVSENVFSAKSPLVILSVRQNVRSTKCPSAKCPFGKMSFGKVSFGKVSFGKMSGHRTDKDGDFLCVQVPLMTHTWVYKLLWKTMPTISTEKVTII